MAVTWQIVQGALAGIRGANTHWRDQTKREIVRELGNKIEECLQVVKDQVLDLRFNNRVVVQIALPLTAWHATSKRISSSGMGLHRRELVRKVASQALREPEKELLVC